MIIGGLQKFSLLDYPGKLSAIIFTQGCNFRCQFCYNPMLVWPSYAKASAGKPIPSFKGAMDLSKSEDAQGGGSKLKYAQEIFPGQQKVHPNIKEDELFVFLKSRLGKLDAVVITGGEPCLQKDLPEFIKKIKALGYLVKLDTNGSHPGVLAELIKEKLIDYIAMDLKAPEAKYSEVTGVEMNFNNIKKSVKMIMMSGLPTPRLWQAGLPYEFRTTVVPGLLEKGDISQLGEIIKGADKWYLQNFKSNVDLVGEDLRGRVPYNARQMNEMAEIGRGYVKICEVR